MIEFIDYLSDIVIMLDEDCRIHNLNRAAEKYFGALKHEIQGLNYFVACQKFKVQAIRDFEQSEIATEGDHKSILWRIYKKEVLIGTVQTQSDLYLESILNAEIEGLNIYWFDQNHRVLLCNNTQAQTLGYRNNEEMVGKSIGDLCQRLGYTPELERQICQNNLDIMNSRKAQIFQEVGEDNKWFISYKAPFYDNWGQMHGVLGVSTDITDRKELERQLISAKHATDAYLESILLSSRSNIYWMDLEGKIIGCNDQQAKCFGLSSRMNLIGKNIFDVAEILNWDPDIPKKIRENDLEIITRRLEFDYEETVNIAGEDRIYRASKAPMFDQNGQVIGIMGIATDITELKRTIQELAKAKQTAEAAYKYKTQFITNISHDIRTPLIGIKHISVWLKENIPEQYHPEVDAIIKSSDELLHLLNHILTLTKLEMKDNRKQERERENFNLKQLIKKLIDLFSSITRQKNILLQMDYASEVPETFKGYPYSIQQIILNLMSNALKFTDKGHVIVRVYKNKIPLVVSEAFFPLIIMVEDTGIGIPEDQLNAVFESFQRLNPSYQNQYSGSGLGLSIAHQSVTNLGGKIWVESKVGQGSCFFVSLNMLISQEKPVDLKIEDTLANQLDSFQKLQPLSIHQSISKKSNSHVLLVEDNVLIQKGTTHLLNKLNIYVDIAKDAKSALELVKQDFYDLILMDIGLPEEDGFWATKQIRNSFPNYAKTPIIAITAHLDEECRAISQEAGMNDIIIKPITMEILLECLKTYGLAERVAV